MECIRVENKISFGYNKIHKIYFGIYILKKFLNYAVHAEIRSMKHSKFLPYFILKFVTYSDFKNTKNRSVSNYHH